MISATATQRDPFFKSTEEVETEEKRRVSGREWPRPGGVELLQRKPFSDYVATASSVIL